MIFFLTYYSLLFIAHVKLWYVSEKSERKESNMLLCRRKAANVFTFTGQNQKSHQTISSSSKSSEQPNVFGRIISSFQSQSQKHTHSIEYQMPNAKCKAHLLYKQIAEICFHFLFDFTQFILHIVPIFNSSHVGVAHGLVEEWRRRQSRRRRGGKNHRLPI